MVRDAVVRIETVANRNEDSLRTNERQSDCITLLDESLLKVLTLVRNRSDHSLVRACATRI